MDRRECVHTHKVKKKTKKKKHFHYWALDQRKCGVKRNFKRGKCTILAVPSWSPVQVLSEPNCKIHGVIINERGTSDRNRCSHTLSKTR